MKNNIEDLKKVVEALNVIITESEKPKTKTIEDLCIDFYEASSISIQQRSELIWFFKNKKQEIIETLNNL